LGSVAGSFWTADALASTSPPCLVSSTYALTDLDKLGAFTFATPVCQLLYPVDPANHFTIVASTTQQGTLCCRASDAKDNPCSAGQFDLFSVYMAGCSAKNPSSAREICIAGCHVCTLEEWLERPRDAIAPTHHFWTSTTFYLIAATSNDDCRADLNWGPPLSCATGAKVCAESADDNENNHCEYFGCGFQTNQPNEYLGGCGANDTTAGTLCCCF
jgi:hypothetical protein